MKDTELNQIFDIPISTLSEWKKKDSKRNLLYEFLKSFNSDDLKKRIEAIKLLKGIK